MHSRSDALSKWCVEATLMWRSDTYSNHMILKNTSKENIIYLTFAFPKAFFSVKFSSVGSWIIFYGRALLNYAFLMFYSTFFTFRFACAKWLWWISNLIRFFRFYFFQSKIQRSPEFSTIRFWWHGHHSYFSKWAKMFNWHFYLLNGLLNIIIIVEVDFKDEISEK